jgi:hypothetical protein
MRSGHRRTCGWKPITLFEKGTVYLNGKPVFSLDPQTATSRHYVHVDLSRHASLVRRGTNVVAIEGEAASQRRAIDVGLYTIQ